MENVFEAKGFPTVFGIRHFSPAGAYYLREFLDKKKPEVILVEGPCDFTSLIEETVKEEVEPPIAVMAYTTEAPIRTILYPFAVYSPEYQALLWAKQNNCECRFCDLPSDIVLGIDANMPVDCEEDEEESSNKVDVYKSIGELSGDEGHEAFWERVLEHSADEEAYMWGASEFGKSIRELTLGRKRDDARNLIREAYMRRELMQAVERGTKIEDIVMIVGAFHVKGILEHKDNDFSPLSDADLKLLPSLEAKKTLMPYSYYRLSERSGYGAGNKAPAYYELLWEALCRKDTEYASNMYLGKLALFQRESGYPVSSAQVIEAVILARQLAKFNDSKLPTLRDLKDAALTCLAHGSFSEIVMAFADTDIGSKIGSLPAGISQTSVQSDFSGQLKRLKLEKYKVLNAQNLNLDLRENLRVSSKESAFLDLNRSFFLHRNRILGIKFAELLPTKQEKATWAEDWTLQWTPEAEIQIVEAVLKGDTIEQAAAFELNERIEKDGSIVGLSKVIEDAFYCGLPKSLEVALKALQSSAVDATELREIALCCRSLATAINYGDIRNLDKSPLLPIISQLFLRYCLILPGECSCDDEASKIIAESVIAMHNVLISLDFLDDERWYSTLRGISERDDLNTRLSGLCCSVLLEAGKIDKEELGKEVARRLSKGIPAELGAGWFEGLSMKNHYALIARLTLWEKLNFYLDTLDDEEFKRSLVFLRRAFSDFSSEEKHRIAENLGELWDIEPVSVSESLNASLKEEEIKLIDGLEDFDFDDI